MRPGLGDRTVGRVGVDLKGEGRDRLAGSSPIVERLVGLNLVKSINNIFKRIAGHISEGSNDLVLPHFADPVALGDARDVKSGRGVTLPVLMDDDVIRGTGLS